MPSDIRLRKRPALPPAPTEAASSPAGLATNWTGELSLKVERQPPGSLRIRDIAQFERDLIREITSAGLAAARARGRVGGRPRLMTEEKLQAARRLLDGGTPAREVAGVVGVSVQTLYRHLANL